MSRLLIRVLVHLPRRGGPWATWQLLPIDLLMGTQAYRDDDVVRLARTARDVMDMNEVAARTGRSHPDVFHPNYWKSRELENRVYRTIIRGCDRALRQRS